MDKGRKKEEENTSMRIKLFDLALEYQNKSNHKEASMGEI